MRFKLTCTLAIVATACVISACGSSGTTAAAVKPGCKPLHHFTTIQKGYLTFAYTPYAPAAMMQGNTLTGIEGDLLAKVAAWECLKVKVATFSNATIIPAVQTGRADLTGTDEYRTAARQKVVNQSLPLYLDRMVLVSRGGVVKTIPQLLQKTVGTPAGNLWNSDLDKFLGGKLKDYQSFSDAYQDLADGRINVVVDGALGASESTKNLPGLDAVVPPPDSAIGASEAPGQANWPTSKSNPALTAALNADILLLRKDGFIVAELKKYHLDPALANTGPPSFS
jgi:polar amino acid transport system substrate-binding protein